MAEPLVECWSHSVPRAGSDAPEDASAVRADTWPLRAAVADGATESAFAGRWAAVLVEGLAGTDATPDALTDALHGWQDQWAASVRPTAKRSWYVEAKVREGAFAAVLGMELRAEGRWRAVAVGDCGLLHLRDGTLQRAWPTDDPDAFTNRPALLPSRSEGAVPSPEAATGTWATGDAFLLATDAVAAWLLRSDPARVLNWNADAFHDAVRAARDEGTLRNDDATLIVLKIQP